MCRTWAERWVGGREGGRADRRAGRTERTGRADCESLSTAFPPSAYLDVYGQRRRIRKRVNERLNNRGIELGAGAAPELGVGVRGTSRSTVGPVGGYGVERVHHANNAGLDGNEIALEPVGESFAIHPLVVGAHDPQDHALFPRQRGQ